MSAMSQESIGCRLARLASALLLLLCLLPVKVTHLRASALDTMATRVEPLPVGVAGSDCTPAQTEGPYFVEAPRRADITEGRPGAHLELELTVVDRHGVPFPAGVRVDLWSADAAGLYSAFEQNRGGKVFDTRGKSFMRGHQLTDARGSVKFHAIVPGWYNGRTTHVHVMVRNGRRRFLTTQLYFTEKLLQEISRLQEYSDRGAPDTDNSSDMVIRGNAHHLSLLTLDVKRIGHGKYCARHILKIDADMRT